MPQDVIEISPRLSRIKHQSTIARSGDFWDKIGMGITPDPFGGGAYNLQSISVTPKKVVWFTRLQLGHAHVLAKDDAILYMHVRNIKILFLFEVWNFWVGRARETTNQVEVALTQHCSL